MKDITFKQVLQYLRELEDEHGHSRLIQELIYKRMEKMKVANYPELSNSEYLFLINLGFNPKFRAGTQEWEINLIDDE